MITAQMRLIKPITEPKTKYNRIIFHRLILCRMCNTSTALEQVLILLPLACNRFRTMTYSYRSFDSISRHLRRVHCYHLTRVYLKVDIELKMIKCEDLPEQCPREVMRGILYLPSPSIVAKAPKGIVPVR